MKVEKYIKDFLSDRKHKDRYASFDYCYNYFRSFYKKGKIKDLASKENLQLSCLHLGFYLASWGMLRGSSILLKKSIRHYDELLKEISKMDKRLWEIDVDSYSEENIKLLIKCKEDIKKILKVNSEILATKIMLGIFGNIPAFDEYFKKGFGVSSVNEKSLKTIKEFYDDNKDAIDSFHIKTLDFNTLEDTNITYTKAKLIDMYGFMKGYGKDKRNK